MQHFNCIKNEVCDICGKTFKASLFNYHVCGSEDSVFVGCFCDECIKAGAICPRCGVSETMRDEGSGISAQKSNQIPDIDRAWMSNPEAYRSLPQSAIEAIGYYVYALVDPRDNQIFYIGKGCGNRILNHERESIVAISGRIKLTKKIEQILRIRRSGHMLGYYILRHNLTEKEAYLVESAMIGLLTYAPLKLNAKLTNLVQGHHHWTNGIKTFDEICELYDCGKIEPIEGQNLLLVKLNNTYKQGKMTLYDSVRGNWKLNKKRASMIDYVLGVYNGIVRVVIKVTKHDIIKEGPDAGRSIFEGDVVEDSPYLKKNVSDYPFGVAGEKRYILNNTTNQKEKS